MSLIHPFLFIKFGNFPRRAHTLWSVWFCSKYIFSRFQSYFLKRIIQRETFKTIYLLFLMIKWRILTKGYALLFIDFAAMQRRLSNKQLIIKWILWIGLKSQIMSDYKSPIRISVYCYTVNKLTREPRELENSDFDETLHM